MKTNKATKDETSYTATATAVRRANSDTLALLDKIRASIDAGNEMTLSADAVFLNIPEDLWSYKSDWYDPFEDPSEQWQRLKDAKNMNAAEEADLVKWLFPALSDEEAEEKIARIKEAHAAASDGAVERILRGEG